MLFVWGSNRYGQLGGRSSTNTLKAPSTGSVSTSSFPVFPAKLAPEPLYDALAEGAHFVAAAAGDGHTMLVTGEGDLMAVGRGSEGQLGLGHKGASAELQPVTALANEVVVDCAAGAMHSLAITASGRVYIWGLVHAEDTPSMKGASGEDPGGGRSEIDAEADDPNNSDVGLDAARGDAREMLGLTGASETLRRIVRESENKWLEATEDEPAALPRPLDGAAAAASEVDAAADERAAAGEAEAVERGAAGDLGAVNFDSTTGSLGNVRRRPVLWPWAVAQGPLSHERVVAVSAGFGHSLCLTDKGQVFACGYNDRGQLGLGHRINCAHFTQVSGLAGRVTVQIACGAQHNLARVLVDSISVESSSSDRGASGGANSSCNNERNNSREGREECELYVWGNGALGQLGLGRKVTGRLIPAPLALVHEANEATAVRKARGEGGGNTNNSSAHENALDVQFVAAGQNHSVCIVRGGGIYSWGHGEYGQHGGGNRSGNAAASNSTTADLVDSFYYYVPRRLYTDLDDNLNDKFVAASCGACFTLGLTARGDVWSWGWHAHGVLGHGQGYFAHMPTRILKLGAPLDRAAKRIACGANHCVALVASSSAPRAALLRPLLRHALSRPVAPVLVTTANPQTMPLVSETKINNLIGTEVAKNNNHDEKVDDDDSPWESGCDVALSCEADLTQRVFPCHRVLLEARCPYLRGALTAAAADAATNGDVSMQTIDSQNEVTGGGGPNAAKTISLPLSLSLAWPDATAPTVAALLVYLYCDCLDYNCPPHKLQQLARLADFLFLPRLALLARMAGHVSMSNGLESHAGNHDLLCSTFDADLERIFEQSSNADVRFFVLTPNSSNIEGDTELWAHRIFLDSVPYFRALLSERFKGNPSGNSSDSRSKIKTNNVLSVDVTGLALDGVQLTTLRLVLRFVYAGSSATLPDHPDDLTELAAAAERLGVSDLVKVCERALVRAVGDNHEHAAALHEWAGDFNLKRLQKHCAGVLLLGE